MEIQEIKIKMKAYRDFYGGDLLDVSEIDKCQSKIELRQLLHNHSNHIEAMCSDAISHLDSFVSKLNLRIHEIED